MESKRCFKCCEIKPLSDFYKHKGMADGHLNKCKECTKLGVRKNRYKNVEHYREYDRARGNRQPEEYCSEWREKNPIKYAAQTMVGNKLRDGSLVKAEYCEECGSGQMTLHGHHDDYARPLDVRWLCPACHKKWHDENGEGKNAH